MEEEQEDTAIPILIPNKSLNDGVLLKKYLDLSHVYIRIFRIAGIAFLVIIASLFFMGAYGGIIFLYIMSSPFIWVFLIALIGTGVTGLVYDWKAKQLLVRD